jgi:hypothetical protein
MVGEDSFSVSAWVNAPGTNGAGCCGSIVAQRGANSWALRYDNRDTNPIEFIATPSWQGDGGAFGTSLPSFNDWHHIVGVLNVNTIPLYVDGALMDTKSYSGTIGGSGLFAEIGGADDGYFKGTIDEVRIYNRALSSEDVQVVMANATSVPEPTTLAIFALGIMGLASLRFMKKS